MHIENRNCISECFSSKRTRRLYNSLWISASHVDVRFEHVLIREASLGAVDPIAVPSQRFYSEVLSKKQTLASELNAKLNGVRLLQFRSEENNHRIGWAHRRICVASTLNRRENFTWEWLDGFLTSFRLKRKRYSRSESNQSVFWPESREDRNWNACVNHIRKLRADSGIILRYRRW